MQIKSQRDAAGMGGGKPPKPPRNVTLGFPEQGKWKITHQKTKTSCNKTN